MHNLPRSLILFWSLIFKLPLGAKEAAWKVEDRVRGLDCTSFSPSSAREISWQSLLDNGVTHCISLRRKEGSTAKDNTAFAK